MNGVFAGQDVEIHSFPLDSSVANKQSAFPGNAQNQQLVYFRNAMNRGRCCAEMVRCALYWEICDRPFIGKLDGRSFKVYHRNRLLQQQQLRMSNWSGDQFLYKICTNVPQLVVGMLWDEELQQTTNINLWPIWFSENEIPLVSMTSFSRFDCAPDRQSPQRIEPWSCFMHEIKGINAAGQTVHFL